MYGWGDPARPPVLLLHSLAAHSHWWDWVAPRLAEHHHVVALDFRGHGASAWADRYTFDEYVADAIGALDVLAWRAPLVLGHSMGGYVTALLAARHPGRVRGLVIADMLTGWSDASSSIRRPIPGRSSPPSARRPSSYAAKAAS